jgi:putative transposase
MPSKNRIKQYVPGDYYHLYNRGVEKRLIFLDEQDYGVFLGYLKLYLSKSGPLDKPHLDLSDEIDLAAYCLMPNHFHLLVKQHTTRGIADFMRCLMITYVRYFNKKYDRVGSLFQDIYKAVRITSSEQLHQVEQYIYLNPQPLLEDVNLYPYSSLLHRAHPPAWIKPVGTNNWQGTTLEEARPYIAPRGLI